MTDYDATAHITEEISDPEVKAPWAISMAMLFTYLAGFLFNIVLCFVMGDTVEILNSAMKQPVAQIFYNVLGKGGGIFFTVCALFIIKFVTFTAMVSAPLLRLIVHLPIDMCPPAITSANSVCILSRSPCSSLPHLDQDQPSDSNANLCSLDLCLLGNCH